MPRVFIGRLSRETEGKEPRSHPPKKALSQCAGASLLSGIVPNLPDTTDRMGHPSGLALYRQRLNSLSGG
jgi:hypothetical protein